MAVSMLSKSTMSTRTATRGANTSAARRVPLTLRSPKAVVVRASQKDDRGALTEQQLKDVANNLPEAAQTSGQGVANEVDSVVNRRNVSRAGKALSWGDAMVFDGPAPEAINGRLAMLGVTSALAAEFASGQSIFTQWNIAAPFVIGLVGLISVASLIPIAKGADENKESNGPFTVKAELLNGRLAMLGIAALIATELIKGSALLG